MEVVWLLLDAGADPNVRDSDGIPILIKSIQLRAFGIFNALLFHDADVDATTNDGTTALIEAASSEQIFVMSLLERGALVNKKRNDSATALIEALRARKEENTILLVENGADLEARRQDGATALLICLEARNEELVMLLVGKGANPNVSCNGRTPLTLAADWGSEYIVNALLDCEADVNGRDADGYSALMQAAKNSNGDVALLLARRGADIEAKNIKRTTPLMFAAWSECLTDWLIKHGVKCEETSTNGDRASSIARSRKHRQIAEQLEEAIPTEEKKAMVS